MIWTELIRSEIIESYEEYLTLFQEVGWWDFIQCFQGYNDQVVKAFTSTFMVENIGSSM